MALNLKNDEVERLATEVARLTGESKTEAIRQALDFLVLEVQRHDYTMVYHQWCNGVNGYFDGSTSAL